MKLMSMVDYVDYISGILSKSESYVEDKCMQMESCERYAKFLSMPLELWMFVACDEDGNLVNPINFTLDGSPVFDGGSNYQKALNNVIFDGFEYSKRGYAYKDFDQIDGEYCQGRTIEYLINNCDDIILTQSAITKYQI